MMSERSGGVLRDIQTLFSTGVVGGLTDGQLLDRFLTRHGEAAEAAFEALVERHGPMVLRVCRGQLADSHDVQDAFQATFLVFVRKAASIQNRESLACWLYGVARKVSARARASTARRRMCERQRAEQRAPEAPSECERRDLETLLHQEIGRLPAKYRAPIVLCYLEGLTHELAAEHLGWPVGSVRGRLARARDLLRARLARRGLAVPAGLTMAGLIAGKTSAAAMVPADLVRSTVEAALRFAAGPTAAVLAAETLKGMSLGLVLQRSLGLGVVLGAAVLAHALVPSFEAVPPTGRRPDRAESPKPAPAPSQAVKDSSDPTKHVLRLDVLDGTTRKPLPDAEVEVVQAEDSFAETSRVLARGVTDDQGHCLLELPADLPRSAAAVARKEGFVSRFFALDPEKRRENHTLMMEPPGPPIGGLIEDEKGRRIAGATVRVLGSSRGSPDAKDFARFDLKVETDVQGRWTCDGVPKTWTWMNVSASHPDYIGTLVAENVQAPTDEQLRARIAATVLTEGVAIHGRVLDEKGKPLAGAKVALGAERRVLQRFHPSTTTDAEGGFRFGPVVPPGVQIVTALAGGHAPELKQVLASGAEVPAVEFRLGPPRTFRGRVVDPKGKPLAGATVQAFNWRGHSSIDWRTETDADGRFAWRDAPPDVVSYIIVMPGFMPVRQRWYEPSDEEYVITLNRPLRIRGAIVDQATGKPIDEFAVVPASVRVWDSTGGSPLFKRNHDETRRRRMANPPWERHLAKTFRDGRYEFEFSEPRDAYFLRVEASGYQPAVSRAFEADGGEQVYDFKLNKGETLSGVVRASDDAPVAGATVALVTSGQHVFVRNGRIDPGDRESYVMSETGPDGRYHLPPQEGPYALIVLHDLGFAMIEVDQGAFPTVITLRPWGRVEGTLRIGSRTGPKQSVSLERNRSMEPQAARRTAQILLIDKAETDARGHFSFDRVVPGEVQINSTSIEVPEGRTTHIDPGGTGRAVIGRAALPPGLDKGIDWSLGNPGTGGASTSLRLEQEVPYPRPGMTPEEKARWHEDWLTTEAGKDFQRAERTYGLDIKPDGTFRVEDVPAGTYTLTIAANWANASRGGILETLGSVQRTVDVPAMPGGRSDEPLDLGTLELRPHIRLQVGVPAPAFDLKTLGDARLKLADLRGKYVLLDFWATWCAPCREETPRLKAVHDTFAKDARFVMIGLSLDKDARDPRAYVETNGMPWPQVHLEGESRDAVLADYGVRTIPSIFLVGPEGTILARDLDGKGIEVAVANALRGAPGRTRAGGR